MSDVDNVFDPYALPEPRKRRFKAWVVVIVSVLLVGGGAGWFFYHRHQQQIAAEDARAQELAAGYDEALSRWRADVDKLTPPPKDVILTPLYSATVSTAQQHTQVKAGCARYAEYGKQFAALPPPPALDGLPSTVADRVPAYGAALADSAKQAKAFSEEKAIEAAHLADLERFCAFFDSESKTRSELDDGEKSWKGALWPNGFSQVVGSSRYSCAAPGGCLPLAEQWTDLATTYTSSFIAPNEKLRALYQSDCPYDELKTQCEVVAATLGKVIESEKTFATALRAKDPAAVSTAQSAYTQADARADIIAGFKQAGKESAFSANADPTATVIYRAVSDNLDDIAAIRPAAGPSPSSVAS